jgi:hypothetical protein
MKHFWGVLIRFGLVLNIAPFYFGIILVVSSSAFVSPRKFLRFHGILATDC